MTDNPLSSGFIVGRGLPPHSFLPWKVAKKRKFPFIGTIITIDCIYNFFYLSIMKVLPHIPNRQGFSLFEMLLTIAILGVILNVMIMSVGGLNQASTSAKNHRNAQEIASLAAAASAAGADFAVEGNEEQTIQNLFLGVRPKVGIFRERIFKLSPLDTKEIQGAMEHLKLSGGQLIYEHDTQTRSLP